MDKKYALVLGAGGFIGNHMVSRLKSEGYWVRGVDLKYPEFSKTEADHFVLADLRDQRAMIDLVGWAGTKRNPYSSHAYPLDFDIGFDEIYQFAADMGGAGYIFTGEHDLNIMHNSATINLNLVHALDNRHAIPSICCGGSIPASVTTKKPLIFYSSSACIYPAYNQEDPDNPNCKEDSAYPAEPDSEYGWEKLFSERLYLALARNSGFDVRIARYHNIYGPLGTWQGGREKAPAAICRKVIEAVDGTEIEIWGDGQQTRSFLYIDDCIDATRNLMRSSFSGPVNIGSEEMVTINELVDIAAEVDNKFILKKYDPSKPQGVRGRNSDNTLIFEKLIWVPRYTLASGIKETYKWIKQEYVKQRGLAA
jgi:GDP-D-mannose 3',5'-epimerase